MLNIIKIKELIVIGILLALVWVFKDYQAVKKDFERVSNNYEALAKSDSVKSKNLNLTAAETKDYLLNNDPEILKQLELSNIKINSLQRLINTKFNYVNDSVNTQNVSNLVNNIRHNIKDSIPFKDKTKCLEISGYLNYNKDSLHLVFTNRKVQLTGTSADYLERKQWKFLFIKSRFLGKKQLKNKIFTNCGDFEITTINSVN